LPGTEALRLAKLCEFPSLSIYSVFPLNDAAFARAQAGDCGTHSVKAFPVELDLKRLILRSGWQLEGLVVIAAGSVGERAHVQRPVDGQPPREELGVFRAPLCQLVVRTTAAEFVCEFLELSAERDEAVANVGRKPDRHGGVRAIALT